MKGEIKAFDSMYLLFELKEPQGKKVDRIGRAMTKKNKKNDMTSSYK